MGVVVREARENGVPALPLAAYIEGGGMKRIQTGIPKAKA